MITEWIDWPALLANGLWVISLSALIAIAGFRLFLKATTRRMALLAWICGTLTCIGLTLSFDAPLQKLLLVFAAVVCTYKFVAHLRTGRERRS